MNLKGKKAIVTGGSRGIGKAIVIELASQGCDVLFTYFSSVEAAQNVESESKKFGTKIRALQSDASKLSEAEKTLNYALESFGGLDILVNNAGISKDNLLLRMSENDFDDVITANLKSVFNFTKSSVKPMVGQRYGRIVNISSVVAITGNPGQANYVASKAGIIGFTKAIAKELASRDITVNAIAPGFVITDMTRKLNEKQKEAIINQIPLKKIGQPEDIARVVSFLVSENANYITGQVIHVDGGMVM